MRKTWRSDVRSLRRARILSCAIVEPIESRLLLSGSISGYMYDDITADGKRQNGNEPVLIGWSCYLDLNNNSMQDAGEPQAVSDNTGHYIFSNLALGNYIVRQDTPTSWLRTQPVNSVYNIALTSTAPDSAKKDFGSRYTKAGVYRDLDGTIVAIGTLGNDNVTVNRSGIFTQVNFNGQVSSFANRQSQDSRPRDLRGMITSPRTFLQKPSAAAVVTTFL